MTSFGFIALVTLSAVLSSSAYYYRTLSPITLCMKSDFSWCTNVSYPNGCVNMDTVFMNSTGNNNNNNNGNNNGTGNNNGRGDGSVTAFKTVESVIVTDVDSTEDKCIVLYEKYNCQGANTVLNGTKHPSAVLSEFGFSNRAQSYRQCTDRVLSWLRDNNENH